MVNGFASTCTLSFVEWKETWAWIYCLANELRNSHFHSHQTYFAFLENEEAKNSWKQIFKKSKAKAGPKKKSINYLYDEYVQLAYLYHLSIIFAKNQQLQDLRTKDQIWQRMNNHIQPHENELLKILRLLRWTRAVWKMSENDEREKKIMSNSKIHLQISKLRSTWPKYVVQ